MKIEIAHLALSIMLATGLPSLANAQPSVTTSTPVAGSSAKRVSQITLSFDAPLSPGTAGAEILMIAMPGMTDHLD